MVSRLVGLIAMGIVVACAQGTMAQCTTVDAVTTASFKITGGQACSTSATLNWTFNESNGTMTIKWGTSTSYGSSKSVYASNPISLTGLTKKTKYYYAVDGLFENKTHQYTRSSFTTSGGGTAIGHDDLKRPSNEKGTIRLELGKNIFTIPNNGEKSIAIQLFTLNGAQASDKAVVSVKSGSNQMGLFKNVAPGMYLIKASWTNGSMQQKIFIGQ